MTKYCNRCGKPVMGGQLSANDIQILDTLTNTIQQIKQGRDVPLAMPIYILDDEMTKTDYEKLYKALIQYFSRNYRPTVRDLRNREMTGKKMQSLFKNFLQDLAMYEVYMRRKAREMEVRPFLSYLTL